ncbi:RHS repeat-associated core domain-containing protein [Haloactinospora alba]|uniref:RHS repeat-associated core domain-containing protein n=1 Tax=Haloactinospora alba TaxID=405555 RepID=UPI00114DFA26|nr:RHS repeat-associated core domain-containing protein [Haloactinospora alba]
MAYDYTPYGDAEADTAGDGDQAAGSNPFTYIGSYEFDNGDKAMGHRYMSHFTERFTQQDPSWQEDNLYTYAECDPINKSDPSGLSSYWGTVRNWTAYGAGAGATAGCALGGIGGGALGSSLGPPGTVGGVIGGCIYGGTNWLLLGTVGGFVGGNIAYAVS